MTRKLAAAVLIYYVDATRRGISLLVSTVPPRQDDYAASAQISCGADRPSAVAVLGEGKGEGEETLAREARCVACVCPETQLTTSRDPPEDMPQCHDLRVSTRGACCAALTGRQLLQVPGPGCECMYPA